MPGGVAAVPAFRHLKSVLSYPDDGFRQDGVVSTLYDFSYPAIEGGSRSMADCRGNVLLLVNVASRCGFSSQYAGLQTLWQRYRDQGFEVIGFPCDQFAHQEPGNEAEIRQFCSLNYEVDFPLSAKIEVNGVQAHPLWQWLRQQRRGVLGSSAIKWNFTKFLVGRDGAVLARYAPTKRPDALDQDIKNAIARD